MDIAAELQLAHHRVRDAQCELATAAAEFTKHRKLIACQHNESKCLFLMLLGTDLLRRCLASLPSKELGRMVRTSCAFHAGLIEEAAQLALEQLLVPELWATENSWWVYSCISDIHLDREEILTEKLCILTAFEAKTKYDALSVENQEMARHAENRAEADAWLAKVTMALQAFSTSIHVEDMPFGPEEREESAEVAFGPCGCSDVVHFLDFPLFGMHGGSFRTEMSYLNHTIHDMINTCGQCASGQCANT